MKRHNEDGGGYGSGGGGGGPKRMRNSDPDAHELRLLIPSKVKTNEKLYSNIIIHLRLTPASNYQCIVNVRRCKRENSF